MALAATLCELGGCARSTPYPYEALEQPKVPDRAPASATPPRTRPQPQVEPVATPEMAWDVPSVAHRVQAAVSAGRLPGCVIAAGDHKGVRYLKAFGSRVLSPRQEDMTEDTLFDLASLSKPLGTAAVAMWLHQEGRLHLNRPLSALLPRSAGEAQKRMTPADLLLHRSGLAAVTPLRQFSGSLERITNQLFKAPRTEAVGAFRYSDTGFLTLGRIIERATHGSLDAVARRHIFEPLGMLATGYGPLPEELISRTAPTEFRNEQPIRGVVHDPRAYRMGGTAGNAGLFSTASDLGLFAAMMLNRHQNGAPRLPPLNARTLDKFSEKVSVGSAVRTLGWDVLSGYSRLRGNRLSAQAFGHGGFTGTSMWIDPGKDLFVIFLSNRVHPDGRGDVQSLVGQVTDELAIHRTVPLDPLCKPLSGQTQFGIDVWLKNELQGIEGRSIALVTNNAAQTRTGVRTLDALRHGGAATLRAVMSPEHGLDVNHEGPVENNRNGDIPVYSLFGKTRRPTAAMLRGAQAIVFDLQDAGVRFFTYMSTLVEVMRAAREHDLPIWVLDRPNPLGADVVEGPLLDPGVHTFVQFHNLPIRHGMTAGELAGLLNEELNIGADLKVVWMEGFRRDFQYKDTGLPFTPPSPNLVSEEAALLYPALALLESSNISVGRGTHTPFTVIGAPYIDGAALERLLVDSHLEGVRVRRTSFVPSHGRFRGQRCNGLRLDLTDSRKYRAVETGLALVHALSRLHAGEFQLDRVNRMLRNRDTLHNVAREPFPWPTRAHILSLDHFLDRRARHLHYLPCATPGPSAKKMR